MHRSVVAGGVPFSTGAVLTLPGEAWSLADIASAGYPSEGDSEMDIGFSEEQELLRDTARQVSRRQLHDPVRARHDGDGGGCHGRNSGAELADERVARDRPFPRPRAAAVSASPTWCC